jgi:hypothetical protein
LQERLLTSGQCYQDPMTTEELAMPKKKQMIRTRRIGLTPETRAGLIPEADNIANEVRARTTQTASMIRTVATRLGSLSNVSEEYAITNILADLRHFCERKGLEFHKLQAAAHAIYLEDKSHEASWPNLT